MKTVFVIVLTLFGMFQLFAQEEQVKKGVITGTVVNSMTQEVLPGANVVVVGTKLGSSTDENGKFNIRGVEVGTYNVNVSLLGFESAIITDVVVSTAKPTALTISLQESKIQLEGVDVTAGYFRKSSETPVSTQEQSAEEIRRLPGGLQDVVRAISIMPGVTQVQAGRNDLIVRGGAPSENLFLIDNLQVPNINHFGTQGASGGPLSYVNLDFVDATSFSTGGFGVRFGDKLSSVLNIKLREGRTDRIGGKLTLSASQFGVNAEGPMGENGTFLFSARRSYLDFIFKAAGFGFVPEYWDFFAKATYRLGARDNISYVGISALDKIKFFNDTPDHRYDNSRILGSDQDQFVNGLSWKHLFSSGYTIVSIGNRYNTYDYRQNDSLLQPIFLSKTTERENSLFAEAVVELSPTSEFSFGMEGKMNSFNTGIVLPQYQTTFGQTITVNSSEDTTAWKSSAFTQLSQTIDRLRLTAGLRADYFSLIEVPWVVSPRLSGSYQLSQSTTINASIGKYHQAPAVIWLVSNQLNTSLDHIAVTQYVAGIEHLLRPDLKVSVEGYVKSYSNYPSSLDRPYLVMVNTGAGFGGSEEGYASFGVDRLGSIGTGRAHGVELFLQKKMSEVPLYGTLSVSYNEAIFSGLDGTSRPGSFDQRWIVNVGAGYVMNSDWEFSAKFRFATGRPYTPYNSDGTQDLSLYNTERIGINHSLDVRADRRWSFDNWSLVAFLDIQNIYNKKPIDVPRYNRRLGKVEEDSGSIGILPSIGISAEF